MAHGCCFPRRRSFLFALQLILFALLPSYGLAADLEIGTWGLQGPPEFREVQAVAAQNAAVTPEVRPGERRFRYFSASEPAYATRALAIMAPTVAAYQNYTSAGGVRLLPEFRRFLERKYPFLLAEYQELAPALYFDFNGNATKQFVLKEIIVKVISFDEYSGGGFSDEKAWYDILLTPKPGTYRFSIEDKKLQFTGSGRAELRFFSNNFYPSGGQSPMGCYMIDVSFAFRVNGSKNIVVKTGAFKIDV
ncbi:hypothetical protein [Rhizobium ruizarguesonis]|uniref:hypothetical protein n=1 Tax=Rhizobium ruizarguesonis TaxID=2081791 RepID=UPI00102FAB0F|nr:hypothetical protein [Rhizobium ruizarguesonis]TAY79699.1 hypothetical protein ELH86_12445 [Rhizobium ruizarguesonis]TBD21810.1 hypothetical protein ELH23_13430 [Rhizobium ruizarguesonis]